MNRYGESISGNKNMLVEESFDTLRASGSAAGIATGRAAGSVAGLIARDADEAVSPLSNPDSATGTAVLERPQAEEKLKGTDDGDADRFAHYVSKRRMEQSRLTGRPVVALCGKIGGHCVKRFRQRT